MSGNVPSFTKAEAGRLGARSRWGQQRVVRIDSLEPPVAAAVRALIAADQASKEKAAAVIETPATASAGGQANDHAAT